MECFMPVVVWQAKKKTTKNCKYELCPNDEAVDANQSASTHECMCTLQRVFLLLLLQKEREKKKEEKKKESGNAKVKDGPRCLFPGSAVRF